MPAAQRTLKRPQVVRFGTMAEAHLRDVNHKQSPVSWQIKPLRSPSKSNKTALQFKAFPHTASACTRTYSSAYHFTHSQQGAECSRWIHSLFRDLVHTSPLPARVPHCPPRLQRSSTADHAPATSLAPKLWSIPSHTKLRTQVVSHHPATTAGTTATAAAAPASADGCIDRRQGVRLAPHASSDLDPPF